MPLPTAPKDPNDKGRKAKEVSEDIQKANQNDDGQSQSDPANGTDPNPAPMPKPKTPEEMNENPAESVGTSDISGD